MISALLLFAAAASAQDPQWNCDDPIAQQEMNYCAAQEFHRADAALNAQWKITSDEMKRRDAEWDEPYDERAGHFDTLLEAQRAWLKYRDAHCRGDGYLFRGGSMESLIVSTCRRALTEERTAQLKALVEAEN